MIYDHRTGKIKLHASDKRFLAGALSVVNAVNSMPIPKAWKEAGHESETLLKAFCEYFGVKGDEHLKREEKEEAK